MIEKTEGGGQNFLHGALILAASAFVVKLIGAFFKVPLAGILGGSGMGYFMTAYDLFNPVRSLAIAGIPVAVSKMVSESIAAGRPADARRTFRAALLVMSVTGVLGSFAVYRLGDGFARMVGNPGAETAVISIAPAIFCCCIISAYRGYYEGQRNMYPTAISQVFEALVKLVCGIGFAGYVYTTGVSSYTRTGVIFGVYARDADVAAAVLARYTAAAAIWGVSVSTFAAMLFLMARHALVGGQPAQAAQVGPRRGYGSIAAEMLRTAVPVCLGSLTVSMGSLVDLFTVMNRLGAAITRRPDSFARQYAHLLQGGMELSQLPNYLYGSYTGLALTIFGIVPAVTTVFGISALPNVAAAWKVRDRVRTHANVTAVLRIVSMLAIPAGLGISVLSRPILELFFSGRQQEIDVAAPLLTVLGVAVIFVSLTAPINSMLQAIGRMDLPVKLMAVGAAIKAGVNLLLLGVPGFGIAAAPLGTLLCYLFIVAASLHAITRETGVSLSPGSTFGRPLLAAAACAAGAYFSYYSLFPRLLGGPYSGVENHIFTLLSIGIGANIYLVLLFVLRIVTKDDVLLLPQGKKILKTLEKWRLIG